MRLPRGWWARCHSTPALSPLLPSASARGWRVPTRGWNEAGFESSACFCRPKSKEKPRRSGALHSGLNSSVANLDARSIPDASIPIPNGGASGPVAVRRHVYGSGRYVDGSWLIVAWAARYRRSKQCTNGQATNHAGGDFTTACNRRPGCNRKTKTACDEQTDQKLSHLGPLRMKHHVYTELRQNLCGRTSTRLHGSEIYPADRQTKAAYSQIG